MASSSTNPNLAPVHTLIARHPRTSMTHASLSSPTETHAAAAGVFPRPQPQAISGGSSPNWNDDPLNNVANFGNGQGRSRSLSLSDLEEIEFAPVATEDSDEDSRKPIEVDPTFKKDSQWPGTVKIVVEATTFWAHKEVLVFASPFFEAVLRGCWAETGRPASIASVITIAQPPPIPGSSSPAIHPLGPESITEEESRPSTSSESTAETPPDAAPAPPKPIEDEIHSSDNEFADSEVNTSDAFDLASEDDDAPTTAGKGKEKEKPDDLRPKSPEDREKDIQHSLSKLIGTSDAPKSEMPPPSGSLSTRRSITTMKPKPRRRWTRSAPDATIHLKEEKAPIFHDFLKFVYPHLECTITWYNVEGLMNLSHKLVVPALQTRCLNFLLTHAAGKPIKAMRIAELFAEEELYREASRFVLDNPGGWPEWELHTLSHATLWKLEKRRTWFLERVLKLGLSNIAKEYLCCATCPDPPACAKSLEEKWRQNYHALFRFGPVQPSMCYRYLRSLEGVSPPLHLTQLSCQTYAKTWIASLFDRMFSLGVHMTPLSGRGAVATPGVNGPRRHFLYCTLQDEQEKKKIRQPREGAVGTGGGGPPRSGLSLSRAF